MTIRVLIADDHAIVRDGLKRTLATAGDVLVVGEATDGAQVMAAVRDQDVDLLLLDMTMPGLSGIDLIRRLRTEWPRLQILVLSMHDEGQIAIRALRAGAQGYLTKGAEPGLLLAGIRRVAAGGSFIDPGLMDAVLLEGAVGERQSLASLSDREFQILEMIVGGRGNRQIAVTLSLSPKTVSTHKRRLMLKLNVRNNADLIKYALAQGVGAESAREPGFRNRTSLTGNSALPD